MARRKISKEDPDPSAAFDLVRTFMDSLSALAWIKDGGGKYVYVNRRLLEDFKSKEADWIGTTDEDHLPNLAKSYRKNDELVLSTGKPLRTIELFERGNRHEFAYSLKFPVRSGDETLVGGVAIEMTEEIRALEGLHLINQTLFRNERLRAIGEFAAGVAHDLSNALNSVMFRLARLRSSKRHEITPHLDALERLVNNAAERVRSINDFVRTNQNLEAQAIDLNRQIRDAIEMVEFVVVKSPTLFGATTSLNLKLSDDLPQVMGLPAEVPHVFANLLLNAREAMQNGGTITLEARAHGESVTVSIADEGHGIASEHLAKVFDPFFTTKPNGSGLGLSMARDVMSRLGGDIKAANQPRGGAIFILTFPIYQRELKRA
ncbi:MAG: ATP-binding protein [Candidatus Binataceae bacterium]